MPSPVGGRAFVVSNGEPRTVHELIARITAAAGSINRLVRCPPGLPSAVPQRRPWSAATVANRHDRAGAEQLSTAHWFDQRETCTALGWALEVSLADGWVRFAASFAEG